MSIEVGTQNRIGFSTVESPFGTSPGITGAKSWPCDCEAPEIIPATITNKGKGLGQYENAGSQSVPSGYTSKWSGTFDFTFDCLAYWLFRVLGTISSSAGPPYTHTITGKQGQLDSFTIFYSDSKTTGTKLEEHTGFVCESLEIGGKGGGDLYIKPVCFGRGSRVETVLAMPALSTEVINPFSNITVVNLGGTITWGTGAVAGGTSYLDPLEDWSITIANDLIKNRWGPGSLFLKAIPRHGFGITTKGTLGYDENVLAASGLMAIAEAKTLTSKLIKVVNSTSEAIFALSKVEFDGPSRKGQRDLRKWPFTGEAKLDTTNSLAGKFFVTNTTASYT